MDHEAVIELLRLAEELGDDGMLETAIQAGRDLDAAYNDAGHNWLDPRGRI